jgi:hypothetical protein
MKMNIQLKKVLSGELLNAHNQLETGSNACLHMTMQNGNMESSSCIFFSQ